MALRQGHSIHPNLFGTGTLFALLAFVSPLPGQTISYVQGAYSTPQSARASVSVTYTAAQKAGDLNVVVVGWNDSTAVVSTVSDSKGNSYALAVGPTIQAGVASQSIYYAKNIFAAAARANTVTVTFSGTATYPDIRVLEYSGADLASPVDTAVGSTGTGAASTTVAATTTSATDLLFGANLVQTGTTGAGTSFTKRLLTSPDGDLAEDRMVTSVGSYSATAPLSPSGQWIMQMVAFRTPIANGGDTTPPTAPTGLGAAPASGTQINLSWTASTDNVGVTQYLVERCQGAGCSNFVQVGTSGTVSFSNTGLTNATAYSYRVRATDAAGNLSVYSNVASAATPDTQAPTAPSSLVASQGGTTQLNLMWGASTDNVGVTQYLVERCQGSGCGNFAQIGTSVAASYSDSGLSANTSYSYRVRATDAGGNLSAYSNSATATTPNPDTQPPTAPGSLTATPFNSTQINLAWTASTDNVGVTQYLIERCVGAGCSTYAQVATSTGPAFNDTALTAGTTYGYRVRATDAAGNLSAYSNSTSATTSSADTQAPTVPASVIATTIGATQINLAWTPSTDNVGVTQYLVERCVGSGCSTFAQVGTSTGAAFNDTGLTASTTYVYRVRASDAAGNLSGYSSVASATTSSSSSAITFVQVNSATPQTSQSKVTVAYASAQKASDLNVVVVGWNDSTSVVSAVSDTSGNVYSLAVGPTIQSGVASQSIYYAKNIVSAAAGVNVVTVTFSAAARFVDIRILEYQGADPVNPVDVTAASSGSGATSNSGVATITSPSDLLFGANLVQTGTGGPGTGFTKRIITPTDGDIAEDETVTAPGAYSATASLSPSGEWIMQMVAFRPQGSAGGDLIPPSAPSNLTGTASSGSQASLSWTAATDNVGVWQYLVERCQGAGCVNFVQVGTSPITTFADTGLAASTSYSYRVRAMDSSGNIGAYSNVVILGTLFAISPRVAELTFSRVQQFSAGNAPVTWLVDGTAGGSATTGTISATGLYTPPTSVGVHTVTAQGQTQSMSATVYVTNFAGSFTRDYDTLRTGANLSESVLTPANVNSIQFGKLFSYTLDGVANASPLYVANVNIPGQGFHNVIYVATEHDSVYAFDADGLSLNPLWKVSFINPAAGITTFSPSADAGDCCPSDMVGEAGITGTPVIDPSTGTLYVSAETKEVSGATTNFVHRLHALDITTGAEKFGGPVVIQATIPGQGDGSSGGQLPFSSLHQNQRAALLLNNGVVYIAWGAHADRPPYHGWIMGYNASTLNQVMVYCSTPNSGQGGIWQSGDGLATDSTGRIYFVTGNGDFNVDQGGTEYGDTIAVINPDGTVSDYFTPHDQANMSALDLDLGSGGTLLLPDQSGPHPHEAISAGKNGTIYLVDRDNMGHYNPNNDNQIVQSLANVFPGGTFTTGNFKAPLYFNGQLYFSADADTVKTFAVTNGLMSIGPTSQTSHIFNYPGSTLSISANGNTNGILWAIERINTDQTGKGAVAPGLLHAFDASNLATELYNSNQAAGGRDALDYTVKWSAPLVANGKVYVTTDGLLAVFGLLP